VVRAPSSSAKALAAAFAFAADDESFPCQTVVGVAWDTCRRGSEGTSIADVTYWYKEWGFFKQA